MINLQLNNTKFLTYINLLSMLIYSIRLYNDVQIITGITVIHQFHSIIRNKDRIHNYSNMICKG
jgi:hypothetical protein